MAPQLYAQADTTADQEKWVRAISEVVEEAQAPMRATTRSARGIFQTGFEVIFPATPPEPADNAFKFAWPLGKRALVKTATLMVDVSPLEGFKIHSGFGHFGEASIILDEYEEDQRYILVTRGESVRVLRKTGERTPIPGSGYSFLVEKDTGRFCETAW